ncbi:alpha/beta fold hydrolase [Hymenobacter terricola]|uniref:alpha/beta fold hydrolase n=1 Tax=Hymenobacter terricola TaxID=2819236 RepID=UPI001B31357C|nr:alpha/beta hydrolase [Hymenobacter terricola]
MQPNILSDGTAQQPATAIKNIVLVHGAWADASCWAKVIPLLQAKGYYVSAVQNPLTSLADDVAATKRALALLDGPALLVGHSWGGAVITEAGNDPRVAGLVYVAAMAPEAGHSFLETAETAALMPANDEVRPDAFGYLSMTPKGFKEDFAQDLSAAELELMIATQAPLPFTTLQGKISQAAWETKPSWYIVASNDRTINPDLQRTMAARMHASTTTVASSHVPMLSQHEHVAAVIVEAAGKLVVA